SAQPRPLRSNDGRPRRRRAWLNLVVREHDSGGGWWGVGARRGSDQPSMRSTSKSGTPRSPTLPLPLVRIARGEEAAVAAATVVAGKCVGRLPSAPQMLSPLDGGRSMTEKGRRRAGGRSRWRL